MKRIILSIAALFFATIYFSCLDKQDVVPPVIEVSGSYSEPLLFSTIKSADFWARLNSPEQLDSFSVKVFPPCTALHDSMVYFPSHTYSSQVNISYQMKPGALHQLPDDSLYNVVFTVYSSDTAVYEKRRMKYKFIYPDIDSFDITLGSSPSSNCLLDIENQCAYPYTQYLKNNYDLVYVNELRSSWWSYGVTFASPDAPCLAPYFAQFNEFAEFPYRNDTLNHTHRTTICGYVSNKEYTWADFNKDMLGREEGWECPIYINLSAESNGLGYGVSNLQKNMLYKFRLYNEKLAMIKVLNRENSNYQTSTIDLRVYYQK